MCMVEKQSTMMAPYKYMWESLPIQILLDLRVMFSKPAQRSIHLSR